MKLLRAATLSVSDLDRAVENYTRWLDFTVTESGTLDQDLAASWGASASAGQRFSVLTPASGRDVFLRFVENPPHPDYVPLTSFGWAAIELCVQDVLAANERMEQSPFEIIGPPREIEGLDAIYPMQVKGPDGEIVYLTQIRSDLPAFDLPRAEAFIDRLFILVMGCSDLNGSLDWIEQHIGLQVGRRHMEIVYTMLANAFKLPVDDLHVIATMVHERDVFLELDQYPEPAVIRPGFADHLPQGVAIGTVLTPDFETVHNHCKDLWIAPPVIRESAIYAGKRSATVKAPDDTLIEVVEM